MSRFEIIRGFLTAPEDQGQAVLVSFAQAEEGWLRKTVDQSLEPGDPDRTTCDFVPWDDILDELGEDVEFEPQNGMPSSGATEDLPWRPVACPRR